MNHHRTLTDVTSSLDERDCLLIADALDTIDPQDQHDADRASWLADAFRRSAPGAAAP